VEVPDPGWTIAADDRTGALEVAAEMVPVAGPVLVTVGPAGPGPVVDLDTRHRSGSAAAAIAAEHERQARGWRAHKIDSMLRGSWPDELSARLATGGGRLVLVPAWPAMGRTCRDGVVAVQGTPVGRVSAMLAADEVDDVDALVAWLDTDRRVAVCDVADDAALAEVATVLAAHDVLVAGPAGAVGAVGRARLGGTSGAAPSPGRVRLELPAVAVCASASEIAHVQLSRLRRACPDVVVVAADAAVGALHRSVAATVAARALERIHAIVPRTIVVVGGDTAAAVLGDSARLVGGVVAPGMPWSRDADGAGPLVVTKAGAFGDPDAIVRLFAR
jgi:uncharacterized protein YgbK (DUF1537 family)